MKAKAKMQINWRMGNQSETAQHYEGTIGESIAAIREFIEDGVLNKNTPAYTFADATAHYYKRVGEVLAELEADEDRGEPWLFTRTDGWTDRVIFLCVHDDILLIQVEPCTPPEADYE